MIWNLLTNAASSSEEAATGCGKYSGVLMIGFFAVLLIGFMMYSRRSQKKRQQEAMNMLDALKPGCKVKTIGGICGIVVEVCPEDNTFILETGSEANGKSYLKFDKQAIYQTDALDKKEETPVEEQELSEAPAEEQPFEEMGAPVEETAEEPVETENVEEAEEKTEE